MYANGRGVPRDLVHAYIWAKLAADAGSEVAARNSSRYQILLSPEELAQADQIIRLSKGNGAAPNGEDSDSEQ